MPLSGDLSGGHLLMGPKDLEFGLLGERLGHSFSPAIHRQLAGYDYRAGGAPPRGGGAIPPGRGGSGG